MNLRDYQVWVHSKMSDASKASFRDELLTGVLGLNGETGELTDLVKKHLYHGHELNVHEVLLELGDIMWYLTATADAMSLTLDEVIEANVEKLNARYKGALTTEESLNRKETCQHLHLGSSVADWHALCLDCDASIDITMLPSDHPALHERGRR